MPSTTTILAEGKEGQISSYITGTATGMSLITSHGVPKLTPGIECRYLILGISTL
jgi:hypothetical protein